MNLLDSDILTLYVQGHARVVARVLAAEDKVATTVITHIEVLQGRFAGSVPRGAAVVKVILPE